MFGFFKRRKQQKDIARHVAGATVVHKSPFDNLKAPFQVDKLSQEFIDKWIVPFYIERLLDNDNYQDKFLEIYNDLNPDIVKHLLGYFDWRARITGAYFSALMDYAHFEEFIGTHLLKSEVCYAGEGYLIALTSFNSEKSADYIKRYLDYYLAKPDLWFDQGDAMAALIWLDSANDTTIVNDNKYLEKWNDFIVNKPKWELVHYIDFFNRRMKKISEIKEKLSNSNTNSINDTIHSSFSNGLKINNDKFKLPNENNLYGTFYEVHSKEKLARLFSKNNWNIRKSSQVDFEVQSDYCGFIIESKENEPSINGVIDISMIDNFTDTLKSMDLLYSIEIYEGDKLIKTACNNV